jgi:hypothetical protein
MNSPGPSVDSSIIIVRQLEQVSEPYRMMFEELKVREKRLSSQCFCRGKKNTKKILFWGRAIQRAECVIYLCFGGVLVDLKSVFFSV